MANRVDPLWTIPADFGSAVRIIFEAKDGTLGLALFVFFSIFAFAFYKFVVEEQSWQDHWQDYRALAEALRVQLYWSIAGVPLAAADNYLLKQDEEVGWVRLALQGPALWATAQALETRTPDREIIKKGWIRHQSEFLSALMANPARPRKTAMRSIGTESRRWYSIGWA